MSNEIDMTLSIPAEIVDALQKKCGECGVSPDRVASAVLLQHLENMTVFNPGWDLLDVLDAWEEGDDGIRGPKGNATRTIWDRVAGPQPEDGPLPPDEDPDD